MVELAGSGDDGTTGLLGGGRAAKNDVRIEAYGTVDEASSALGLARSLTSDARVKEICEELQRDLYKLGAELATNPATSPAARFGEMTEADVERLEELMATLESEVPMPAEFVLPGGTPGSGALDLARTVIRRAERRVVALADAGGGGHNAARRWLNRLSLLVFVLARYEEARAGIAVKPARSKIRKRS
jgi:cob(I)alamin adenosyltransferase